jgi:hypothetical protein
LSWFLTHATDPNAVTNGGATVNGFAVTNGAAINITRLAPSVDSTNAILIQRAGGTNVVIVDTANNRVGVGVQPSNALDVNGSANIRGNAWINALTINNYISDASWNNTIIVWDYTKGLRFGTSTNIAGTIYDRMLVSTQGDIGMWTNSPANTAGSTTPLNRTLDINGACIVRRTNYLYWANSSNWIAQWSTSVSAWYVQACSNGTLSAVRTNSVW